MEEIAQKHHSLKHPIVQIFGLAVIATMIMGIVILGYTTRTQQTNSGAALQKIASKPQLPAKESYTYDELLNAKKIPSAQRIIEVSLDYSKTANPAFRLAEMKRKNGYPQKIQQTEEPSYTVEFLDESGEIVTSIPLTEPTMRVTSLYDETSQKTETTEAAPDTAVITTLWREEMKTIQLTTADNRTLWKDTMEDIVDEQNNPSFRYINTSFGTDTAVDQKLDSTTHLTDGTINVVFIGSGYPVVIRNETIDLISDTSQLTSELFKHTVFNTRKTQFNFFEIASSTPLCSVANNSFDCDEARILALANTAAVPYDKVFVIHPKANDGVMMSFADMEGPLGGMTRDNFNQGIQKKKKNTFLETFGGYMIAGLLPEYVTALPGVSQAIKNCYDGTPPNAEWNQFGNQVSYVPGCVEPDWYRSSLDSIMAGAFGENATFNAVSSSIINDKIDALSGYNVGDSWCQAVDPRDDIPSRMTTGERKVVKVRLKNAYISPWYSTQTLQMGLASQYDAFNTTWGLASVPLTNTEEQRINYFQDKEFTFTITAPSTPGTYRSQWQMYQEAPAYGFRQFFGEVCGKKEVIVTGSTPTPTQSQPTPTPTRPQPTPTMDPRCTCTGADITGDQKVDIFDLTRAGACVGIAVPAPTGQCVATDVDRDGATTRDDLECISRWFGEQCN